MDDTFDSNSPIYLQLMKLFTIRIAGGEWGPGERVMTVRDLAVAFKVNPNTVQRALSEMEREGLMFTERTTGRFITNDKNRIDTARSELAEQEVSDFIRHMKMLGYEKKDWMALAEELMKKENI